MSVSKATVEQSAMYDCQIQAGEWARLKSPEKPEAEIKAYEAGILKGWKAAIRHCGQ